MSLCVLAHESSGTSGCGRVWWARYGKERRTKGPSPTLRRVPNHFKGTDMGKLHDYLLQHCARLLRWRSEQRQQQPPEPRRALLRRALRRRPADTNRADETVAAPHHSDDAAPSPEDFATPASSDSPEDPEDVDHEDEADDVDRDRPEADPEDEAEDSDEDDGVDIDEDEVDGHTPFIDSDADSNDHQQDDERPKSPRNRDKGGVKADHEDEEITFADLGLPRRPAQGRHRHGLRDAHAIQKEANPGSLHQA